MESESPISNLTSPNSYDSDIWIQHKTGPRRFKEAPGIHQTSSDMIKNGVEWEPTIFGQAEDRYQTPSSIQWLKAGKLYKLDVQTGLGYISIFSSYEVEGPSGRYKSTSERVGRMDEDDFQEAIDYLSQIEHIQQSQLLIGIEGRRIKTFEDDKVREEKRDELFRKLDLRKEIGSLWKKIKASNDPDELDKMAARMGNIQEELRQIDS